jgi:SAM-dependent methyltransferase
MLEIDTLLAASAKEMENLSWYEITSRLGLLSFNTLGSRPIERIAALTGITDSSSVLAVGCGAGGTAVHLAEMTHAEVYGIDLSPESIRTAIDLASKSPLREKLHFQICDAHALPFPPDSFDVVIAEYMGFFLKPSAFEGFFSVLKPGGYIALAELMKDPEVNAGMDARITSTEALYSELLGYGFHIPLSTQYAEWLTRAGFEDVHVHERFSEPGVREKIRNLGGWRNLFKIVKAMLRLMRESPLLRRKFIQSGRVKRVLYQSRSTARFIFQAVLAGRKPTAGG